MGTRLSNETSETLVANLQDLLREHPEPDHGLLWATACSALTPLYRRDALLDVVESAFRGFEMSAKTDADMLALYEQVRAAFEADAHDASVAG